MINYFGKNNLKAIILAAGEGKRLRPLTDDRPKAMVKLFGMSLLERQINIFRECGINDIIVVTGYKDETIDLTNIKKYKNFDYASTNMVETLFCAENEMDEQTIISYGDIIFEKKVLTSLINSGEDYSVVIDKNWRKYWESRFADPLIDAESLRLDSMNNIIEIGQTTKNIDYIQGQYIGLMKFQDSGLKFLRNFYQKTKEEAKKTGKNPLNPNIDFKKSYMTDFIQGLINAGCKIKAISINNGWLELDNNDDYRIYNEMYENGKLSEFIELENKI
jgi:L-glutamine-phosphate cytidylyltransferase